MIRFDTAREMQQWSLEQRRKGLRISFVPTMGYLHEGHLALMDEGLKHSDLLVVSIFVNPMQFNDPKDLDSYPMDEEGDLAKIRARGCAAVFFPKKEEIYPEGYRTKVFVEGLNGVLCGASRPGHFDGVSTICSKLFNIVLPDVTVFGSKDYQQLTVIRSLVRDLNFPIEVIGLETVREPDGLALSSRNARLREDERGEAVALSEALYRAGEAVKEGETDSALLIETARASISARAPSGRIDYIEVVDADTLEPVRTIDRPSVMALAVYFEKSRLIDNLDRKSVV